MRVERAGAGADDRDDRVGERFGAGRRVEELVGERRNLALDHRAEQGLAAGEAPVDGGAGAAGLAGDVVEGGLGDADPRDADEGAVEDAVGEGRRRTHLYETVLRRSSHRVNVSQVTPALATASNPS